jgi:hypothetical protein
VVSTRNVRQGNAGIHTSGYPKWNELSKSKQYHSSKQRKEYLIKPMTTETLRLIQLIMPLIITI